MFKIEGYDIHISRCNKGVFELRIPGYTFNVDDTVEMKIYKKKGLNGLPVKTKEIKVNEAGPSLDVELTRDDTNIGSPDNKIVEYWYEIELNDDQTVIGFDDKGAKKLYLYPKGVEKDDQSQV